MITKTHRERKWLARAALSGKQFYMAFIKLKSQDRSTLCPFESFFVCATGVKSRFHAGGGKDKNAVRPKGCRTLH